MARDTQVRRVEEFMTTAVWSLDADMPIEDALVRLRKWGYSGAPVTRDGQIVGVLSEVDCMKVLSQAAYYDIPEGTVADHMTADIETIAPGADVFAVANRLIETGYRRLPVCEGGRLVGLVTVSDIDRVLWEITQERHKIDVDRHPGAAWDPRESEKRDQKQS